ncbi:hypothetical protein CsatB_015161 [Cannabis sativa]
MSDEMVALKKIKHGHVLFYQKEERKLVVNGFIGRKRILMEVPPNLKLSLLLRGSINNPVLASLKLLVQFLFIFHTSTSTTLILVYVDDIIITGSDSNLIANIVNSLNSQFSLKDLGDLSYFLGIEVKTTPQGLHLSQSKYIRDLLIKSQMEDAKPLPTPMVSSLKLSAHGHEPFDTPNYIGRLWVSYNIC